MVRVHSLCLLATLPISRNFFTNCEIVLSVGCRLFGCLTVNACQTTAYDREVMHSHKMNTRYSVVYFIFSLFNTTTRVIWQLSHETVCRDGKIVFLGHETRHV